MYDTVYSKTFCLKNDIMHQLLLHSLSRCYFLPQREQSEREELVSNSKYQDRDRSGRKRKRKNIFVSGFYSDI